MTIKPILFNTDMVRAILNGRKTVTRRAVKGMEDYLNCDCNSLFRYDDEAQAFYCEKCGYPLMADRAIFLKQLYRLGDILYVCEIFFEYKRHFYYKADGKNEALKNLGVCFKWRPSAYMPKEAARIFLRVTDVRIERLQEIDDEGAKAEGANYGIGVSEKMEETSIDRFSAIWNHTIKKNDLPRYGWNANPWVWVIQFERCEKPLQYADADTAHGGLMSAT